MRPPHVDESNVVGIGIYDVPIKDCDVGATWLDIKANAQSSFVWSENNGGHWIALAGADVKTAYMTPEVFSSTDLFIPPNGSRDNMLIPLEQDPPESLLYRKVIVPPLMPANLKSVTDIARKTAIEAIEGC